VGPDSGRRFDVPHYLRQVVRRQLLQVVKTSASTAVRRSASVCPSIRSNSLSAGERARPSMLTAKVSLYAAASPCMRYSRPLPAITGKLELTTKAKSNWRGHHRSEPFATDVGRVFRKHFPRCQLPARHPWLNGRRNKASRYVNHQARAIISLREKSQGTDEQINRLRRPGIAKDAGAQRPRRN